MFKLGSSSRTFRPHKGIPQGDKLYELKKHAEVTLGSGDLQAAVKLPEGEDLNEWLAVNTVDFFNQINMLYGTIMEFCTTSECPVMSAGPKFEYMWYVTCSEHKIFEYLNIQHSKILFRADGKTVKKAIKVSAPEYMVIIFELVFFLAHFSPRIT